MNSQIFYIHLLKALQRSLGERLVYIENKGFYIVQTYRDENGNHTTYESLDSTTTLFNVPKENKIYHLDKEKDIAELVRNAFGTLPLHGRNVGGAWSQGWRFVVGNTELTANQEAIAEKYGIDDLSESYDNPYYKQILAEIRKLTIEAIERATRNKKSKKQILLLWDKVRTQAEENDYLGLEGSRDELLKLAGKQKRGENASLIREAKKEIREELWSKVVRTLKIWTTVIIFFTGLGLSFSFYLNNKILNTEKQTTEVKETVPTLTRERIAKAIDKHNQTGGTIIYQWRREKIIEYLLSHYSTLSEAELQKAVDTLATTQITFWRQK